MPNIKDPLLVVSASLDEAKSKKQLQKQLDKVSKELSYKITGDTQKQVSDTNKVTNAIKIQGKEREKVLQYEQKVRYEIEKQTNRQANAEKLVTAQLDKQREKLALFQAEMERKSTKLTSGKYGSTVDTSSLSSLQSRTANLSIGSASDIKSVQAEMGKINSEFKNLALNAQQARTGFTRLGDEAKHNFQKIAEYAIIGGVFMGMANQIKVAITASYDLDNAINQVRIVTGQTEEQAQSLVGTFKELAKTANVSLTDTAKLYADLTRQGLEGTALEERFLAISKYSKISGLDVSKSMDIITSAVNGTKRPVEEIIDVFAVLGDKSSSDSAEIGEALQRTASVANVAGIDFKKLSAYIATVSESTRVAASVVGQSMRSMIVRFNQLREQGFNEEDTTQINDVVQALSTIGIDAFDDSTQSLMNFSDILEQLAPKWDTLDEKTRNYLQTSLAGNYQADKFAALMSNYTRAQELYGYALDSSGQATEKFEIYQESAQAKVEKFQLALENLYTTLANSTVIKGAIDTGTDFVNLLALGTKDVGVFTAQILALASAYTILKSATLAQKMASSGGIMAVLGFTAPELMLIALAIGAVSTAFITYKNNLEQARISAENFKKAQEDLNYVLGKGGDEAQKRADDIDKVILEYDTQTEKIKKIREEMQFLSAEDPKFGELANKLNDAKKALSDTEKELADLGVTAEEARAKIGELNKAQELSKKVNESLSKLDLASKQQKELDTVNNLIASYESWVNKKKKSKQEDDKLVAISATLASKLSDLGISYELNSKGLVTNTNGVRQLVKAKVDLTNTSISSATKEMTIEKQRLSVMLSSIKTELEARRALMSALAGSTTDFAKASAGDKRASDLITDPLGLKRDKTLDKTTAFLEGQAKQYEDAVGSFDKAINEVTSKTAGVPDLLSGAGDDKSKDKSKKDPYLSNLNLQYQELERQLALTNQEIKDNANLLSNTDVESEKIKYLEKEISLNKTLQSQYANIAKAKRGEMATLQSQLNKLGLGVSFDKEDNVTVKNWKKINSLSEENRKIADELISKLLTLSGEVNNYGDAWGDANNKIKADEKSIADIRTKSIEETTKKNIETVKDLRELISNMLEQQMKDEMESRKELIKSAKDKLDITLKELEAEKELADFTKSRAEKEKEVNKLGSKIVSLQTAASQGDMKAQAELLKLEDERAKKQEEVDELINNRGYELKKEGLQNQYEAFEANQNKEIDEIEKNLKNAELMTKAVNERLNMYLSGTHASLFTELINWNKTYGTGIDQDIISKWEKAISLIKEYNSQLGAGTSATFEGYESSQNKESIMAQMKANGAMWANASPEERKRLNEKNIELARSIGYGYNASTGQYFNNQGESLFSSNVSKLSSGILSGSMVSNIPKISQSTMGNLQSFFPSLMSNMPTPISNQMNSSPNINVVINGTPDSTNINKITDTLKQTVIDVSRGQLDAFRNRGYKPQARIR